MKRIISIITVSILCLCLLCVGVSAASATVAANGPQSVEVGQTLTVALNMNGSDIYGMSGKISYDNTLLKLESSSSGKTNWLVEFNGNNFVVYDNTVAAPVNGSAKLVVLNFTVLDAAAGKNVSVAFTDLVASDAQKDIPVSNTTYTCAVTAQEVETSATTEPETTEAPTTKPTTNPTKPTVKPTEPAPTETTAPATTGETVETTGATEAPTVEAVATEATEIATEGEGETTTAPAVGTDEEHQDTHRCLPWWLLIVVAIVCLTIGYFIGVKREKKRAAK